MIFFGALLDLVEVVGLGAGGEVLPPAVADDEHDDAVVDALGDAAAPASAAPDEMPAKTPTSAIRRVHSIDSRGRTMRLPSSSSVPPHFS